MPFTPFHLGPGALFKGAGATRFSFMVFGGSQVLMDIEPLIRIAQRAEVLHGVTHTVAGALAIGLAAGATGKPISEAVLKWLGLLRVPITWTVSFMTGLIGTYSHILLDGIMHADMNPLWPFADGNPLLGLLDVGLLHVVCAICGVVGSIAIAVRWSMRNDRNG
jgi:hypothetical protein